MPTDLIENSIPYSLASLMRSGISGSPFLNSSAQAAKKRSKQSGMQSTVTMSVSFPVTFGA
jgi:hypothetical protein